MAANLSRPDDIESSEESVKTTCTCSNISIMQLFHEMKQEFPTVPDNIVSELVADNCHNRSKCIKSLKRAAIGHPISAQAYPSQSIHNSSANKLITNEQRRNSETKTLNSNQNNKNNDIPESQINQNMISKISDSLKNLNFMGKQNNNNNNSSNNNVNNKNNNNTLQRPTTLTLSTTPNNNYESNDKVSGLINSFNKPTRIAPPPPPSYQVSSQYPQQPQSQLVQPQQQQNSPKTTGDDPECLNVSVNVTVSPISGKPPLRPPRLSSALLVQPEPPFTPRDTNPSNPRSYTSVNFTLRQPTNNPQSPINISAGPGLTYSSSSFDAKQGYQSRLQITVGGSGCSSISAMRTRQNANSSSSSTATSPANNSDSAPIDNDIVINSTTAAITASDNSKSHHITYLDNIDGKFCEAFII